MKAKKVKFTIKFPRCIRCRGKAKEADLDDVLEMLRESILYRTGKNIPISITLNTN